MSDALKRAIEALAAVEHDQWWQWAVSVLDTEPGLSHDRAARWRSLFVPYAELSEAMKEHDRKWARKAFIALGPYIEQAIAAEREACAKACDDAAMEMRGFNSEMARAHHYDAAAIRARGKEEGDA